MNLRKSGQQGAASAAGRLYLPRYRASFAGRCAVPKGRRATALLLLPAFLWVFTQLVMNGFMAQSSVVLADGSQVITICSGTQLTTITVDADGNPVEDSPAKKISCPWCAQFGGVGPVPMPDPSHLLAPLSCTQRVTMAQVVPAASSPSRTPYASRAPPLSTRL